MKKKLHSIDVIFHHRICDAQKHLVQEEGNLMNDFINQVKLIE